MSAPTIPAPAPVYTKAGARDLDRAAAAEVAARAAVTRAAAVEAEQLARLRVDEARSVAAERTQQRQDDRRRQERWRRQEARRARAERRATQLRRWQAAWADRRSLAAVVPMMGASAAVALPAQYAYYAGVTGSGWSAAAIAAMVEGGTWVGAALEAAALEQASPVGAYRLLTWSLASVAAAVNVAHGLAPGGGQVAVVYGLASLLGVTAWSAYVRLRGHQQGAVSAEALRLAAWRRVRYPRLSWRATSLRAAVGVGLAVEDAWQQVWAEHHQRAPRRPRSARPDQPTEPADQQVEPERAVPVEAAEPVELSPEWGLPAVPQTVDGGDGPELDASTGAVEWVSPVPVTWVEPPPVEPPYDEQDDEVDPDGTGRRLRAVRTDAELRRDLAAALVSGQLEPQPSVEAVRVQLGISWRRARDLVAGQPGLARATA